MYTGDIRCIGAHTASDDNAPVFLDGLTDRVQRLLLSTVDKAAGVDENDVGTPGIRGELDSGSREVPEHRLPVDQVLGATEADQEDAAIGPRAPHRRRV